VKLNAYSVYDVRVCFYSTPFYCSNDVDALRFFYELKSDKETIYHRHPQDFQIYHIGEFDDQTGLTTPQTPVRFIPDMYAVQPDNLPEVVIYG